MDAFLVVLSSSLCELALSSYLWSLVQFDRLVHFLKKFFHEPRNFSCFFISLIIVVVLGSINAYNLYAYTLPHKRKIDLKRETNVLFYAEKFLGMIWSKVLLNYIKFNVFHRHRCATVENISYGNEFNGRRNEFTQHFLRNQIFA